MTQTKQNPLTRLSTEVVDIVREKYNVIGIIVLSEHDLYPEELATILVKYCSHNFSHNDRLIVLHDDTDYYPNLNSVGNTVYNFFRLCANFDISVNHILFFTNHYNIEEEIKSVAKTVCNSNNIAVICTSLWADYPLDNNIDQTLLDDSVTTYEALYACLNGQCREHRLLTLCMMSEHRLLDRGVVSYHFKK